jgi:hypothetical protein
MFSTMKKITDFKKAPEKRYSESGNVLFLILIAVALFAALSYAVTQSSRSGGGDASSETNLISSASLTQYPAAIRTSIIRMIVSSNIDVEDLNFDLPADFATVCTATPSDCVFHPRGGGATYAPAPGDVMDDSTPADWSFNADFELINLGLSNSDDTEGNEIIAFLPGIKRAICNKINEQLNFATTIPVLSASRAGSATTTGYLRNKDNDQLTMASTGDITLGTGGDEANAAFDGEAFGCFQNAASGDYVYFHVLVER